MTVARLRDSPSGPWLLLWLLENDAPVREESENYVKHFCFGNVQIAEALGADPVPA